MPEKVYLAGPITGLSFADAVNWREAATDVLTSLGYEIFSPMREKYHLKEEFGSEPLPHTHRSFTNPFARDRQDVWRADYMLVNLLQWDGTTPLVGTSVEIGMARAWHKFIILVSRSRSLHPFLSSAADLVVESLEQAYEWLDHMRAVGGGAFRFEPMGGTFWDDIGSNDLGESSAL